MRKPFALVLALGLLVGGAAACSDDEDDAGAGDTPTTTVADGGAGDQPTTTAADGGEGEAPGEETVEAANDAVIQEYCDASEAYADALEAGDPAVLEEASGRLGEASDAVSPVVETFTAAQQQQFEECTDAQGG